MPEWMYRSTVLDLGNRGEVSNQLHDAAGFRQGTSPLYQLERRLGGPQSQSGRFGKEKYLVPPWNRTTVIQPVS
jgi:hypothetical protein